MSASATLIQESIKQGESEAAYERWVQAELSRDPRLTALRILYNDIRTLGEVKTETWDYFDLQEKTGGAESMDTQHITLLSGEYDAETDEIVAAFAGGERVTYEALTQNGIDRSRERLDKNPDFAFQLARDQVYYDTYHGPIKAMWHGDADYDTVIYVSAFPQEVIDQLGERGRTLLAQELAYDVQNFKGFINVFRRGQDGKPEGAVVRVGNALPTHVATYLQKRGIDPEALTKLDSHQYGSQVITLTTGDQPLESIIAAEVAMYDQALLEETDKQHRFGRDRSGIDAYELFKQCPRLWGAYRDYHKLLAQHFNGTPLSTDLYDYLISTHDAVAFHVLEPHEMTRLSQQLDNQRVTPDMALACKKIMTYAHYATINRILEVYEATGVITDIDGADIMQAYGEAAGGSGGDAAARGEIFNDCDAVYGAPASNAAIEMAARNGISIEEAVRRLTQRTEKWSDGQCRNCERETQVWRVQDGGCNICKICADAHTRNKEIGLREERKKAQAERERDLIDQADIYKEATPSEEAKSEDEISVGTTRYVNGQKQVAMRWISTGSATIVWVDANTGRQVDREL